MCPGCEATAEMLPAHFLTLDKFCVEGRSAANIFFLQTWLSIAFCPVLSCLVAELNQTVMKVQRTDSIIT